MHLYAFKQGCIFPRGISNSSGKRFEFISQHVYPIPSYSGFLRKNFPIAFNIYMKKFKSVLLSERIIYLADKLMFFLIFIYWHNNDINPFYLRSILIRKTTCRRTYQKKLAQILSVISCTKVTKHSIVFWYSSNFPVTYNQYG